MPQEPIFSPERVTVMGVLNLTPDSFSDGGRLSTGGSTDLERVERVAREMVEAGADILDLGGESTRPGAREISAECEIDRVIPALERLHVTVPAVLSIDTRKASVAEAALSSGARIVNDVSGLTHDADLAGVVARFDASLILGHTRGTPDVMQDDPRYDDVLAEVAAELDAAVARATAAGVERSRLAIDPGIGFGKDLDANLQLIAHVGWLRSRLELPVLVGPSRKAFLGRLTGDPVHERDAATHAACAVAAFAGADAVRVHSVPGAVRSVVVGRALRAARRKELS